MDIALSEAKAQLTDLVRRAEAGEEIVLTRHGQPVARITPLAKPRLTPAERKRRLDEIVASARKNVKPGPSLKEIDEMMYDEFGLPK